MNDKLSVVIPAYNEEKNIVKCLAGAAGHAARQYHIPYEIIVVNDNSRDRTEERRAGPRWPRTRRSGW